jgi:hypothetical protein
MIAQLIFTVVLISVTLIAFAQLPQIPFRNRGCSRPLHFASSRLLSNLSPRIADHDVAFGGLFHGGPAMMRDYHSG